MGLLGFNRGKGIIGEKIQQSIDNHFPICPMCGSRKPYWKFKATADLTDGRVQFRCDECKSILSITNADLTGFSKNTGNILLGIYTGPVMAFNAVQKTLKGKKVKSTYIKIEKLGYVENSSFQQGQEIPIEELQEIAKKL